MQIYKSFIVNGLAIFFIYRKEYNDGNGYSI